MITKIELKTTTDIVRYILKKYPQTRNSDNYLYIKVLQYEASMKGINIEDMSVLSFYEKIKELEVPSIETVGRCRRKIVESHPELAGDSSVEAGRRINEEALREFSRR